MSTFTLAISCLTTSSLLWFMDLTFQVRMQYCSLQHRTLLLSPVPSTSGCCFCFGSISSFFLELFLHWSPITYWASTNLGSASFSVLSFCLFILFIGFSRQEYWSGLPFHSILVVQWTTFCQASLPWPVHLGWPHMAWLSFIELEKAVVHVIRLASCLWLWFLPSDALSQCLLSYWGFSYLGCGVSPHGCRSSSWTRGISSQSLLIYYKFLIIYYAYMFSHIWLFVAHGLQLSRLLCPWDFPRQEYWSGLPFPTPGDLSDPGTEPATFLFLRSLSLTSPFLSLGDANLVLGYIHWSVKSRKVK